MSSQALEWKSELATLPVRDRAELAYFLLESLGDDGDSEAAWDAQLQRRIDDVQQGRVTGVPVCNDGSEETAPRAGRTTTRSHRSC